MATVQYGYEYYGYKNCYKIIWGHFSLIITKDMGPRVLSLSYYDTNSIFAMKDVGKTFPKIYGHRLWHAPENKERSYCVDNSPITVEFLNQGTLIIMRQDVELATGIKKTLSLELKGLEGSKLSYIKVSHYLENKGVWPVNTAPWAITVLEKGAKGIIPLSNDEITGVLPKTSISLWNYTKLQDPRLTLGNKYIMVQQQDKSGDLDNSPNKIGSKVNSGWSAAYLNSILFVKVIDKDTSDLTVDYGCNVEIFTDNDILELETIGKCQTIEPTSPLSPPIDVLEITSSNKFVSKLTEKWYLFQLHHTIPKPQSDQDVDNHILPIINEIFK